MTESSVAHFTIKYLFQKGGTYSSLLPPAVLSDICLRLTGQKEYTVDFDDSGYNIGRLVMLEFGGHSFFVSISEVESAGRNSSFQSFPSAMSRFILQSGKSKSIVFYIHPNVTGNFNTDYFRFMYRIMATIDVALINIADYVPDAITPFSTPDEQIDSKERLRARSKGNRSTYVTTSETGAIQVYGKTYGASKYETTLICLALVKLANSKIELYQVEEGGLTSLPAISLAAIQEYGEVSIGISDDQIEAAEFLQNNSLRSIKYIYNLLERLGKKKCVLCGCQIAEIIHGAHIWPVSSIKSDTTLSLDVQIGHALNSNNGIWLCGNHHKLFDSDILLFKDNGEVKYKRTLPALDVQFLHETTVNGSLPAEIMTKEFVGYLGRRNMSIDESAYLGFEAVKKLASPG